MRSVRHASLEEQVHSCVRAVTFCTSVEVMSQTREMNRLPLVDLEARKPAFDLTQNLNCLHCDTQGLDEYKRAYKMGQTAAEQLRHVIVPHLVQLVGDVKTQRVSVDLVLAYLQRQQLFIDEQMLRSMFAEADFKHENSLAIGPLSGAIQGRYKAAQQRQQTLFSYRKPLAWHGQKDWLALVSLILRRPLTELQDLLAPVPSKRYAPGQQMTLWKNSQKKQLECLSQPRIG